jgi:hypothetical protein
VRRGKEPVTRADSPDTQVGDTKTRWWRKPLRSGGWIINPADVLRRRLTRRLEVDASREDVQRGDEVEALVTLSNRKLGQLEIGLVCTEYYAKESTTTDSDGTPISTRSTAAATSFETWLPIDNVVGVQSVSLAIPEQVPFSYKGSCLSFTWELVARGRRRRRLDAQARHEITVLP